MAADPYFSSIDDMDSSSNCPKCPTKCKSCEICKPCIIPKQKESIIKNGISINKFPFYTIYGNNNIFDSINKYSYIDTNLKCNLNNKIINTIKVKDEQSTESSLSTLIENNINSCKNKCNENTNCAGISISTDKKTCNLLNSSCIDDRNRSNDKFHYKITENEKLKKTFTSYYSGCNKNIISTFNDPISAFISCENNPNCVGVSTPIQTDGTSFEFGKIQYPMQHPLFTLHSKKCNYTSSSSNNSLYWHKL